MTLRVGDTVRTASSVRPSRFADRSGAVAEIRGGEVGVVFGAAHDASTWFDPAELTPEVGQRPLKGSRSPATSVKAQ